MVALRRPHFGDPCGQRGSHGAGSAVALYQEASLPTLAIGCAPGGCDTGQACRSPICVAEAVNLRCVSPLRQQACYYNVARVLASAGAPQALNSVPPCHHGQAALPCHAPLRPVPTSSASCVVAAQEGRSRAFIAVVYLHGVAQASPEGLGRGRYRRLSLG